MTTTESIEFQTARERLEEILRDAPFPVARMDAADLDFLTVRNGVPLTFAIRSDDLGKPLLLLQAIVLADVPLSNGLYEWAATEGQWNLRFAAAVHTSGDGHDMLTFTHSIDLSSADAQVVFDTVQVMLDHAVRKVDDLAARFGGSPMRVRGPAD